MKIQRLYKQNVMTLRRSSSPGQVDTSNVNQMRAMEEALRDSDVNIVAEIDLQGVTGSMPGNRTDIDEIIQRKLQQDDFKFLVLPCADRFTRAGELHGKKILYDLGAAGVTVYFVQEDIFSDNEASSMRLGFLFDSARKNSSQTSFSSLGGQTFSFKDGKSPYTRLIPYGTDRLYYANGKRSHILRNLADGTQEMWTPEEDHAERTLIQTFEKNPRRGTKNHYQKQRNETLELIPGNPEHVKNVIRIMKERWVDGLGDRIIAKQFNAEGILSPRGSVWCMRSIFEIARRPIYLGLGFRGRTEGGIYHITNNDGAPIPANRTIQELATCNRIRNTRRTRDEWLERPAPAMENFLPPDLREICAVKINKWLDKLANAPMKIIEKKEQVANSPYLLTSILKSKQGNRKMVGSGSAVKHYVTAYSLSIPNPGRASMMSRCFRVEPLHKAVLEVLREVLINRPTLKEDIQQAIDRQRQEHSNFSIPDARNRVKALRARQIAVSRHITGSEDPDDPVFKELQDLDRQVADLREKIDVAVSANVERPTAFVLHRQFIEQAAGLDDMDRPMLKAFLKQIITRMEADLMTREVEMDLTIPHWIHYGKLHVGIDRSNSVIQTLNKVSRRHSTMPDLRPKLFTIRLKSVGRGPSQYYSWEVVPPENLNQAA